MTDEVKEETKEKTKEPTDALLKELANKFREYTLLGDYPTYSKKILNLKRWSFGQSAQLLPMALEIFGSVITAFAQSSESGNFLAALNESKFVNSLSNHLTSIGILIAKTLVSSKEFKTDTEALVFVNELENVDIINITKIIYQQNMEFTLKNVFPAGANAILPPEK